MGRGERRKRCRSPLGAIVRGAIAGAAGTAAMDGAQYAQYRRGGGTRPFVAWETSEGLDDWDSAPAPAKLAKRLFEGLAQRGIRIRTSTETSGPADRNSGGDPPVSTYRRTARRTCCRGRTPVTGRMPRSG